jgi:gamma-glutamyltranspeptidase/glutathione hydrolase
MISMKLFRAAWLACGLLCANQAVAQSSAAVCSAPAQPGDEAKRAVDGSSYNIRYDSIDHPVIGREGMVVTQSDLATQIGAEVLRDGGNAVDSTVAVGFALAVTLPRAGNLGGSGFMLLYLAEEKRTVALEYYSQAPASIRVEQLRKPDGSVDEEKRYSRLGAGIPGTVAGLWHVHQKYGKLPWKRLVRPAIELAAKGIVISDDFAYALEVRRDRIRRDPSAAKALYKANGESYRAGERFVQKDLAWSLREIERHGAEAFYRGAIARKIVADMQANGGAITMEDLARYQLREQEPIWSDYRGHRLALMPPPASGVLLAELMNVIENFPMRELGDNSVASIHVVAEATKRVFADRGVYFGGYPDYTVPVEGLTSKQYARSLAQTIDLAKSSDVAALRAGDPMKYESRDTTHFSIMDAAGNAISNTYTLGSSFGAHVMVAGTGMLLNDHIFNFALRAPPVIPHSLDTSVANALAPGKRSTSAITPVIVFDGERPYLVSGSPDGARIIPAMAQLLVNVIDHGLNIAEATGRPRVFQNMGSGELELEPGHPVDIAQLLQARGHRVKSTGNMGSTQSVMCTNGLFFGGADTRRPDAAAIGIN